MHITDEKILDALNHMAEIDNEHPDEALRMCEETFAILTDQTDPYIALQLEYRRIFYMTILNKGDQCLEMSHALIEKSRDLGDDKTLAKSLNLQGNLYGELGLIDKSLEAYLSAMRIAEQIGFYQMIGNVANNIGNLYHDIEDYDHAEMYFHQGLNSVDPSDASQQAAGLQGILNLNLAEINLKRNYLDQALAHFNKALTFFEAYKLRLHIGHAYTMASEIYQAMDQPALAEDYFLWAQEIYTEFEDIRNLAVLAVPYASYLYAQYQVTGNNEPLVKAKDLLHAIEAQDAQIQYPKILLQMDALLGDIYGSLGDLDRALSHYKSLEKRRQLMEVDNRRIQLNVLKIRFEIERSLEEKELIQRRNQELRDKSEELISKKEALEAAYHRIQLISEIGQKITSTLDLSEILLSVHDHLKHQMPIDSFYMVMLNEANTHLVSVASVEQLVYERTFEVAVDNPQSLLALSYREKRSIFVPDILSDPTFASWDFIRTTGLEIRSVIVVPLLYDDVVIGVCSVQTVTPMGYHLAHKEIMEALSTYLAIAINNAQRSKRLEQEIQMRLRTQKELERLNAELRSISEIDGLTKVPNRRRFESVYEQMFEIAMVQKQPLHVLMMDIDYFKVYNDHYGHLKGDEVLIAVAQKLNQAFKFNGRLFARYGGEEFVAVLGEMSREEAEILAQELRISISNLGIFHELSPTGFLTISIGMATMVPSKEGDMRRLLHQADACLYRSKNNGRNRVEADVLTS